MNYTFDNGRDKSKLNNQKLSARLKEINNNYNETVYYPEINKMKKRSIIFQKSNPKFDKANKIFKQVQNREIKPESALQQLNQLYKKIPNKLSPPVSEKAQKHEDTIKKLTKIKSNKPSH